jgi:SAM-dependent methyltransferase
VAGATLIDSAREAIKALKSRFTRRVFTRIYVRGRWRSGGTPSGAGSTLEETEVIRAQLPNVLRELEARSMLDIPCGDFNWMQELDLGKVEYIGADIVAPLIEENRRKFASERRKFLVANVIKDVLPSVDLVLCRDCLVHLSNEDALRGARNIVRSHAKYLLMTTYPTRAENKPILTGQWRAVNLQLPPFGFPPPLRMINENCRVDGGRWSDKSLGLWRVADLL